MKVTYEKICPMEYQTDISHLQYGIACIRTGEIVALLAGECVARAVMTNHFIYNEITHEVVKIRYMGG